MDKQQAQETLEIITQVVERYFVPQMREEEKGVRAAYEDMQRKLDLVMKQVSDLKGRMADSSRCWNCGAALPRSE